MSVYKYQLPVLSYASAIAQKRFSVRAVHAIGDIALLRETFGANHACTGRAEVFRASAVVDGNTTFSFVHAES